MHANNFIVCIIKKFFSCIIGASSRKRSHSTSDDKPTTRKNPRLGELVARVTNQLSINIFYYMRFCSIYCK